MSLISYSADTQVGINTTREVNQVVDTDIAFANSGEILKAGELNLRCYPWSYFTKIYYFWPGDDCATHNLTLGAFSAGATNNTFTITTKGGSEQMLWLRQSI